MGWGCDSCVYGGAEFACLPCCYLVYHGHWCHCAVARNFDIHLYCCYQAFWLYDHYCNQGRKPDYSLVILCCPHYPLLGCDVGTNSFTKQFVGAGLGLGLSPGNWGYRLYLCPSPILPQLDVPKHPPSDVLMCGSGVSVC